MKYFETTISQSKKDGQFVCGDYVMCTRTPRYTLLVLCDGIGSGTYANIAAITAAERLTTLCSAGMDFLTACKEVAASMHEARVGDVPFAAFSAARIFDDGYFYICSYEAPEPLIIRAGKAEVLPQTFRNAGYEVLGESSGMLELGDRLVLCSDGVTQAGMGQGYTFGITSEGLARFINKCLPVPGLGRAPDIEGLVKEIDRMTAQLCGERYVDDTTTAVITCREAKRLTVATGPPRKKSRDRSFAENFINSSGSKVICGSTTTDIISRELGLKVKLKAVDLPGMPPEYEMEGVDLVSEGAIMLTQVCNLLDENVDSFVDNTPAERLCRLFLDSDHIDFMLGQAMNEAHTDMIFKQVGIRARRNAVDTLVENLRKKGKLIRIYTY